MFPFLRGHGHGFQCPPLSSIADVHRRADESRLPCLAFTSTRIAQSGGVSTPRSAQHIASIHLRPTETGFSFLLLQQRPTCHLQQALRCRGIRIPAKVSLPPARPGPPTRFYGAAQAVALAARASGTPFDPRSLDLPSIGTLVGFYHACLGFPVKQTWLDGFSPMTLAAFLSGLDQVTSM